MTTATTSETRAQLAEKIRRDLADPEIALSAGARRNLENLAAVLGQPDPIGPEGWDQVRRHVKEYGVHIGGERE
jgi:hypothetical protein